MSILKIRIYPDPILRKKSEGIEEVDDSIRRLMDDMTQTMYENKGVGLAAIQVGILKRVIIVDVGEGLIALANPRILRKEGRQLGPEGCLSLPDITLDVKRAQRIMVKGLNREGKKIEMGTEGLTACALQHEIDHLNGILIIDRVPKKRLRSIKTELERLKR